MLWVGLERCICIRQRVLAKELEFQLCEIALNAFDVDLHGRAWSKCDETSGEVLYHVVDVGVVREGHCCV